MRPRKTILVVHADERERGMWKFVVQVRGYRPLMASDAPSALALHALGVDLVLGFAGMDRGRGPLLDWQAMSRAMKVLRPEIPVLLVGPKLNADELYAADLVLNRPQLSCVELMEHVRSRVARKRGPRKAELVPAMVAGD